MSSIASTRPAMLSPEEVAYFLRAAAVLARILDEETPEEVDAFMMSSCPLTADVVYDVAAWAAVTFERLVAVECGGLPVTTRQSVA
jgi:hypothetical protein